MSRGLPTAPEACRHDGMRRWTDHVHSWHARSPWMQGRGDGFSFRSEYRPLRHSGAFSATTEEAITFAIAEKARRGYVEASSLRGTALARRLERPNGSRCHFTSRARANNCRAFSLAPHGATPTPCLARSLNAE